MITAPPKGDITGGSDCYLNTHIPHSKRYQVILQDATEGGGPAALSIQKSGNIDRSESRESKKIRNRRSKRVKREKATI